MDVALRRSIPASNADVRNMQRALEDIAFKLRIPQRKPWQQMTEDVIKATSIVNNEAQVCCCSHLEPLLAEKPSTASCPQNSELPTSADGIAAVAFQSYNLMSMVISSGSNPECLGNLALQLEKDTGTLNIRVL